MEEAAREAEPKGGKRYSRHARFLTPTPSPHGQSAHMCTYTQTQHTYAHTCTTLHTHPPWEILTLIW